MYTNFDSMLGRLPILQEGKEGAMPCDFILYLGRNDDCAH